MDETYGCDIRTILVADDDLAFLSACKRGFGTGRRVLTASNSEDARVLAGREHLDLAVVDLRLGTASGLDLIRHLRAEHPNLIIALVSGYLSVAFVAVALREGANVTLFKPLTCGEILRQAQGGLAHPEPDWEETPSLARAEWEHITRVLNDCHGNVSMAARRLGVLRQSLQRRLRKYSPRT